MLLDALRAPVTLEWETLLEDHNTGAKAVVYMSLDLDTQASAWPPGKFKVRVVTPEAEKADKKPNLLSASGLEMSSSISASQLADILRAGSPAFNSPVNTIGCEDAIEQIQQDNYCAVKQSINDLSTSVKTTKPTSVSEQLATLPLVDSDTRGGVVQPACLRQWHGNVCGHHALFNIQCLLDGQAERFQSYDQFWQNTLNNIQILATHGEASGRWPASRVTKGVADEAHLQYLIEATESLRGRVSIAQTVEGFNHELQCPDSAVRSAIDEVIHGRSQAHGFLLGATNHWYSAVAIAAPRSDSLGQKVAVQLFFCDSYNRPLGRLQSTQEVEDMVKKLVWQGRSRFDEQLCKQPEWAHRPKEHLDSAFEEGLTEWWKGIKKASLFWREAPLAVKLHLKKQELEDVRSYLKSLAVALGLSTDEENGA